MISVIIFFAPSRSTESIMLNEPRSSLLGKLRDVVFAFRGDLAGLEECGGLSAALPFVLLGLTRASRVVKKWSNQGVRERKFVQNVKEQKDYSHHQENCPAVEDNASQDCNDEKHPQVQNVVLKLLKFSRVS